jgi:hypothetical protein
VPCIPRCIQSSSQIHAELFGQLRSLRTHVIARYTLLVHISTLCHSLRFLSPHHFFLANQTPLPIPHFFLTPDMSDQSGSSHLRVLFEAALQDYRKQTGIALAEHPLAERLQNCDSVESVTAVLREQTQAFREFRGNDKVLKPLKRAVSVLYKLSALPILVKILAWYVIGANWCSTSLTLIVIAFPACESNTHRPRCPTLRMCLFC